MQMTSRRWLLRERTTHAHAAVDSAVGGFDDLTSYKAYLQATAAFRAPIEAQLAGASWPSALAGWQPSTVSAAIAADMSDLGVIAPRMATPGPFLDGDRLYGALYVLEGSALGAKILFRRAQVLGLSAEYGARHLALLSSSLESWRGFLDRLETVEPFDLDLALEGSLAAFASAHAAFEVA